MRACSHYLFTTTSTIISASYIYISSIMSPSILLFDFPFFEYFHTITDNSFAQILAEKYDIDSNNYNNNSIDDSKTSRGVSTLSERAIAF